MCGRFILTAAPAAVAARFGLDAVEWFPPRYNIAPGQPVAVVRLVRGGREFGAGGDVAGIADRMPAILAPADCDRWLDSDRTASVAASSLLRPPPAGSLEAVPVGDRVNSAANDDPGLVEPPFAGPG